MTKWTMALSVVLFFACGRSEGTDYGSQLPTGQIMVDGITREYRYFIPTNPPQDPMPLLITLNGGGMRDYGFPQEDRFVELAEAEGFVIVSPLSHQLPENEGEWQLNTTPEARHDVDFIEALIDQVSTEHPVDSARIYVTGYSLGSMFTYELACHLDARVAAVASFAGTMPVEPHACELDAPLPVLHIHGEQDYIIAYGKTWDWKAWDTVGTMMDIPGLVTYWKDKNACQGTTERDFGALSHVVHDGCDGDVRVEHFRLGDVGHAWPESIDGVSTHQTIWGFLSGFRN